MTDEEEKEHLVKQRILEYYEKVREVSFPNIRSNLEGLLNEDNEINEIFDEWGMDYDGVIYKWFEENSFDNPMSPTLAYLVSGHMISVRMSFVGGYEKYAQEFFTVNGQDYGVLAFLLPDPDGESKRDELHILFTLKE